ncbi:uncharacterized protein A1O9_12321, partial [Exophiala aquamarina CBS 119918]
MRFSVSAAAATAVLAGVAVAEPLTVINPCPAATSTTVKPITVTKQYQAVSTCAPTTACLRGSCTTRYPFETFAYVSTVIPAAWDGKNLQTTTVTSTTQTVTVSRFQTTLTKWITPAPVVPKTGTATTPKPTSIELTIAKDFFAPYNKLGPLAIPGYDGSGLCKECETQPDGSRSQVVGVVECRAGPGGSKCMGYDETWISKPAPSTSATTANACSTRWVAPSAGTYTFTFPFTAPARVITAAETTITVGPVPYWAHVTRVCHRPHEIVDFTTTITKTIYWTAPCSRQPPRTSSAVPAPTGKHAFPGWPRPGPNGGNNGVDGSKGDPYSWADWGSDDAADPNLPIPGEWADWVATATVTKTDYVTQSTSASQGPIGQSTSTSSQSYTYTTSSRSTTSSSTFSQGPTGQSTTTSGSDSTTSSSSSSSSSSGGPIGQSTTTSGSDSTTTSSSSSSSSSTSSGGPIGQSTSTSSSDSTTSVSTTSGLSTTSVDSTTSTITSFTTTSAATTTSGTASTTTSLTAIPVDLDNFVIGVNTATKYRKRALRYIKISGDGDAVLTTDKDDASIFSLENGYLKSGGLFVDADTTQSWLSFSLTAGLSSNISQWTVGSDGSLTLLAANIGICVAADNSVFIQFSANTPFLCIEIALVVE